MTIDEIRKRHEAQTGWRDYDPPATMYQDRADLLDEIERLRAALVQIVNAWDGPSEIDAYKKAVENVRSVLNPQQ